MNDNPDAVPAVAGRSNGRFTYGNKCASGNPVAKRMHQLRTELLECASTEDVKAMYGKLKELALAGDVAAARTLLDHLVGKATQPVQIIGLSDESAEEKESEMRRLLNVVVKALEPFAEARIAVGQALMAARKSRDVNVDVGTLQ